MKYPRTYHLPYSPGSTSDDKMLKDDSAFRGKSVIVTEKLDGENLSLHSDKIHARSENMRGHESQSFAHRIHAQVKYLLPENIQIVGEYLYAQHSIFYGDLTSFFYVVAVIDKDKNEFLSWEETKSWAERLGLPIVPTLYEGIYDPKFKTPKVSKFGSEIEGYVVRISTGFNVTDFSSSVAKWVRTNHITTDDDWRTSWKPNKLK